MRAAASTLRHAAWVALPAAGLTAWGLLEDGDPAGRFRAGLVGLALAVVLGAFGTSTVRAAAWRLPASALLAGAAALARGADADHVLALAWLVLAVSVAAGGLAALGRELRAPAVAAGGVAALVLWTAMAGLFWADPVAEHLPRPKRQAFRQAVLHQDPLLAYAYDGAGFDRLRSDEVYFDVPLASSLLERPRALSTGGLWLSVGLAAWLLAGLVGLAGGGKWGGGTRRQVGRQEHVPREGGEGG